MIEIKPDERVIFVGKTGSGKTYAARALLASAIRLVVLDGKCTINSEDWRAQSVDVSQLPRLLKRDEFRVVIRPLDLEMDQVGLALASADDTIVYVDELYHLAPSGRVLPQWSALWTRGRERNISMWAGVQRPARIPLVTLSEANHYFVFRLSMPEDRRRIAEVVGLSSIPVLRNHGFLYANPENENYRIFSGVRFIRRDN